MSTLPMLSSSKAPLIFEDNKNASELSYVIRSDVGYTLGFTRIDPFTESLSTTTPITMVRSGDVG